MKITKATKFDVSKCTDANKYKALLTTSSVVGVLVRSVLTVFDPVTNQRLKQALGSVLTYKLHVARAQRVCG